MVKGMKQTEIGMIPEDWEIAKLKDIADFQNGLAHENIESEFGEFIAVNSKFISQDGKVFRKVTKQLLPLFNNDLCIVMSDIPNGKALAKCFLVEEDGRYTLNQRIGRISPIKDCSKYLFYTLNRNKYFLGFDSGSGQTNLRKDEVLACPVLLPPLPEQEAIAAALSDADAWIESLEQLIAKKRLIKQGAMQELLTPKDDWEVKIIREIVATPVTDGPHETPFFLDKGIPFLSVNNIVDNKIDWSDLRYISEVDDIRFSKKCKPRRGDILLGKAASVGKIAIVESDYNFNIWSPLALIRIDEISNKYCFYYLQTTDVLNQIKFFTNTSSQGNIGMGDIEKIEIKYPKSLSEQTRIATILSDVDAELEALEQQLHKVRQIKQGMMQELLTGRIRLNYDSCEDYDGYSF
ncbi:type I restriction endonuclease subunit S [Chryseobacterium sp. 6424]|uniref:restriction endonuclease subunit S n=1 Tax=Chryseobacterium sp. 6424 TaxID=2039166 RepID=UPI000EFA671B|nr:restriction endonuclease subunit S [Chryseobacterium sp. 6424]AYO57686.1 type I restriction endonuclease subunit S [Chryseobacterium sp. 6424]